MCGIAGFISFDRNEKLNFSRDALLNLMKTRGPDTQKIYKSDKKKNELEFFSSRLSIIDLNDRSNQPFKFENFIIIFNGEIYNFLEIKIKLLRFGYNFKTESDTEVLLKAYIHWGDNVNEHLDGMWAFAIYDLKKNFVFLSRDHFGQKPLFYYRDNKSFIFGSEIKYIFKINDKKKIREINYDKLKNYIQIGYRSINKDNNSFFKNIKSLEPGTYLKIFLKEKKIEKNFFFKELYKKNYNQKKFNNNDVDYKYVLDLLVESLEKKTRSDVPISFSLSGGIDSTILFYITTKIIQKKSQCFSIIDKDKKYNENKNIKIIEKDLNILSNKVFLKKEKNFLKNLEELIIYHDSPISTISYYVQSKLTEEISKKKIRVNISGTGADEIFGGYYDHFLLQMMSQKGKRFKDSFKLWSKFINPLVRNHYLKNFSNFKKLFHNKKYLTNSDSFIFKKKNNYEDKIYTDNYLKNRMLNELFEEVVPVILKEDDLNSMKYSIENRSPYLDLKLFRYLNEVDVNLLIQNGYSKYILRKSLNGIVPDKILWNREKIGFNANIFTLLNINPRLIINLVEKNVFLSSIIDKSKLKSLIQKKMISNKTLFAIINTSIFLENFES